MEKLAIIDHNEHRLFIEDVTDKMLAKYNGDEQAYIEDNYDMENYSWDYIVEADYIPSDDATPIEINFDKI